jgi:hypothetical protein
MGLTKIDGFEGEAEILGGLHRVEFSNGSLAILGLSLDAAYGVLDALASKTIRAVRVQPGDRPEIVGQLPDPPKEFVPPTLEQLPETKPPPKLPPATFAGERASDRAAAGVMDALVRESFKEKQAAPVAASKDAEPSSASAGSPPPPTGAGDGEAVSGVPAKVVGTKRFIEVLEWLLKERKLSTKDVDGIVAALEEIKAVVPVVGRVRDLRDKVVANLAAWAENGG